MNIHTTAAVHPGAELAGDVTVGPGAVIEEGARLAVGVTVEAHAVIRTGCRIGAGSRVGAGSVLGGAPQDLKYRGEPTELFVGERADIREFVTLNRSTGEGTSTVIGNDCFLMANAHVGHNCRVGNGVVMANLVALGGHVEVGDRAFLGGLAACHQFVRVGAFAMVGGGAILLEDVPPYMLVEGGHRPKVAALNTVGLMRAGFSPEARRNLKIMFRILTREGRTPWDAAREIESRFPGSEEAAELVSFIRNSRRGLAVDSRPRGAGPTVREDL